MNSLNSTLPPVKLLTPIWMLLHFTLICGPTPAQSTNHGMGSEVAGMVNPTTLVLSRIDLQSLLTKSNAIMADKLKPLVTALNGQPIYFSVELSASAAQPALHLMVRKSTSLDESALTKFAERFGWASEAVDGPFLQFSPSQDRDKVSARSLIPTATGQPFAVAWHREEVTNALPLQSTRPIQALIVPPKYLWEVVGEVMPTLPSRFGGGPSSLLTEGVQHMTVDLDAELSQMKIAIHSRSPGSAKALAEHLPKLVPAAIAQLPVQLKELLTDLTHSMQPHVQGSQITLELKSADASNGLSQAIDAMLGYALGMLTEKDLQTRLRSLALACLNYESANKVLPPNKAGRDAVGKSYLSWRVHLLPFLGTAEAQLYQEFHLNEAWDSPHNIKLLDKIPRAYQTLAGTDQPYHTTLVAPVGDDTVFGGNEVRKLIDFGDGTSNTALFVQVKPELAVPWTAPQDYLFDQANPTQGLVINQAGKFIVAFADASVTFVSASQPADAIIKLFRMNDR